MISNCVLQRSNLQNWDWTLYCGHVTVAMSAKKLEYGAIPTAHHVEGI